MGRKQNPEQRRRELCDAAIRLLADEGIKGLTHLKVDRTAGVPDGTTSFYFRTSSALLHAVAGRVAELDLQDLTAATEPPAPGENPAAGLAALVMRAADGPGFVRSRARLELAMPSSRDPELAQVFALHQQRFVDMHRGVVQRLSPDADPAEVAERTYVLLTFISGLLLALSRGDRTIGSAEQLEAIICSLCRGGPQPEQG
ncbi:TetR/AcrR family transcriptional regulator [Mycolicibacterium smegmatis]|uniref:Transcriptional regulator, TetR family protein n=1 Tax=Mycolicibacterium smegmatis (strain MKD8) TaxID=1214915 RepID=A0A2U9PIZ8_MYCSE|nr:TetR family transcriptional regulator [Mycolicibacterium smegmatis]AWT51720.1 transcriptional regulator, TetR family protein [Mycolicibacterium smegmatis MKD8]